MSGKPIQRVVILGGGTAGWMAAASLSKFLGPLGVAITLIESERIGTVGVGEATIPPIMDFLRVLGIDEDEIVARLKATFKLGIGFRDWTKKGSFYFHPFGPTGFGMGSIAFSSYWLKMMLEGKADRLEEYSMQAVAAREGKFMRPVHAPNTPLNKITYALHFDATEFARYLRVFAEARGVVRHEGMVREVKQHDDGFIDALVLENGEKIEGDLFLDCSGFRGLLIEETLKAGYEDWRCWLPCDRALAVATERTGPPAPFTLSTAREAGWQWRIPLQHRIGNGLVYCSGFMRDDDAHAELFKNLDGKVISEPLPQRFVTGKRKKIWEKNCVALGLSAGFLEPLESTSIHLIQRGIAMLLKFFPDRDFEQADIDRYNKILDFEFSRVRDFLLLHYTQTMREGPFWEHCRSIAFPDSLAEKADLFLSHGRILREDTELFPVQSWLFVMIGQGMRPRKYDPLVDSLDPEKILANLADIKTVVARAAEAMPSHQAFIDTHCAANLQANVATGVTVISNRHGRA
ncbi:tryptophan halogenase [Rhizomicrobium palustre]|uniref:Tryptophan halogenase n=1 Tax=Rhizomicrobium palustre TaxID=189966 RepID=A0A846N0E9_9PROT|nr:tryptophan halogenase [Rhizomicrobium palustre]